MFGIDAYTSSMQFLNPKLRYTGKHKNLHALDAPRDIYVLASHVTKLSRETQVDRFLMYPVPKLNVGDKVLVRTHTGDVWNSKYDVVYHPA